MRMIFALLLGVPVTGCGGGGLVKVEGVLNLDGEPVVGAMVTFIPLAEGGRNASGQTGPGGVFHLTTLKPNDGAFPGEYKVVVQYVEAVETLPATNMRAVFESMQKARAQKNKPPKYVIPAKYAEPGKSDLIVTIPGRVLLDLKSQ
jgi:hypothetical protein